MTYALQVEAAEQLVAISLEEYNTLIRDQMRLAQLEREIERLEAERDSLTAAVRQTRIKYENEAILREHYQSKYIEALKKLGENK